MCWEPTQVMTWLGTVLDMSSSVISATNKHIGSLKEDLASLLAAPLSSHPVRKLASVCGKIISLGSCVDNLSRLMSRNLFAVINSPPLWNSYVVLLSEALAELNFWKDNRCGYTGHFLTWEIVFLPRETAFSSVTDVSRGKFPVLNIHGYVKKITRNAHDI